ncbi:sporulation protein Cse60 [Alicyclobacillus fastidiosus]|uniref:Sporulation protein Cse60 n=1 Tax=Alicyclobacillus fastidiosus TaxID=392011 RepID=A0ABY6ZMV7_9BACL|nr:sporulation protein Cse60 [Alicyclobacillus fastidiosus]WAH43521.1 sporulation protein Cse60 [Alicyclobacillus fastidiosus]GMA59686.1 hypothetical protein GCM10025859_01260 [Alicyclobacillus fastidiosus]
MALQIKIFDNGAKNVEYMEEAVNEWLSGISEDQIVDIRTSASAFGDGTPESYVGETMYVTILYRTTD